MPDSFGSKEGHGAIWSYDFRLGAKIRRFDLGGVLNFHHMVGKESWESFSLLQLGPEIKYIAGRTTWRLTAGAIVNRTTHTLDDLGDLAGHGSGKAHFSGSFLMEL